MARGIPAGLAVLSMLALLPLVPLGWDAGLAVLGSVGSTQLPSMWLAAALVALVGPAAIIIGCFVTLRRMLRAERYMVASAISFGLLAGAGLIYFWIAHLDF